MKKVRLLCISPYEGMRDLMLNIAARRDDIELIIHVGNLEDGVKAVTENMKTNIDAIISRGGTAEIIRENFSIPISEISLSVYDVLRSIKMAQSFSDKFAVVGFSSITKPAILLSDLLQYDIEIFTIHSTSEAQSCLENLKADGYSLVVGDTITVNFAKKIGINGILITSGIESVEECIDNAIKLHKFFSELKESIGLLSSIASNTENEIFVYDIHCKKCFSTETDLPQSILSILERNVPSIISGEPLKIIRKMNGSLISITGKYLNSCEKDYCIYTISKKNSYEGFNDQVMRYLTPEEDIDSNPFENYLGSSDEIQTLINDINRYSIMNKPVLILGEPGTGKDRFAHYLYSHSKYKNNSLVYIDCSMMSDKHWKYLLESDSSPLTDSNITIYMKRLGNATPEQRMQLKMYLKSTTLTKRNLMIFSFSVDKTLDEKDELYLYLIETLACLILRVPSLRQRPSDIPILVGLYINTLNLSLGTQVVGFAPEAMAMLQNFSWTRNIDQLIRIIRELVITTKTSYISTYSVQNILNREKEKRFIQNNLGINLKRPLNEITREIVMTVFEEEGMNQTKTAKRLNISRSTLWRMLK